MSNNKIHSDLKCIILDWDGTLVSCENLVHAAYVLTFEAIKSNKAKTWQLSDTHNQNGKSRQQIFNDTSIWGDKTQEAEKIFYEIYPLLNAGHETLVNMYELLRHEKLKPLTVFDGAKEFLKTLYTQRSNARIVLLGAKNETLLKREVEQVGLTRYFDKILGNTGNITTDKPSAGAFARAVEGLFISSKSKQVLYIGDNEQKDKSFAQSWGSDCLIIQPKNNPQILLDLAQEIRKKPLSIAHQKNPPVNQISHTNEGKSKNKKHRF